MHEFDIVPAGDIGTAAFHAAFVSAFADYVAGPFQLPRSAWFDFLARQAVDMDESRIALGFDGVLAFALVAPRPDASTWRLATMGAIPEARGGGAAPALLDDFIARAARAGRRTVELECFAQNGRALRLYRSRGFREAAALHGYAGTPRNGLGAQLPAPRSVSLQDAFAWLDMMGRDLGALPLQATPAVLRCQARLRAWRVDGAQLIVETATPGRLAVASLVDTTPGQAATPRLVRQALAEHPGCTVHVPQLQRADLGGDALERMGLERLRLHQVLMRRPAAPA